MKILALDYGRARVGLAISDALGITCRPLAALKVADPGDILQEIQRICTDEEVGTLLLGIPFQLDGQEGAAVEEVRAFQKRLHERVGLPIREIDERLSSKEAHAWMKSAGVQYKQRREHVDSTAAWILLKNYLASGGGSGAGSGSAGSSTG